MKLVPDWREAWRWYSMRAFSAIMALPVIYATLPKDWQDAIPDLWLTYAAVTVAGVGMLSRLIDQTPGDAA